MSEIEKGWHAAKQDAAFFGPEVVKRAAEDSKKLSTFCTGYRAYARTL